MALFATKHAHITLAVLCGANQGSSFACPSSNTVASFNLKAFSPLPRLPHKPLVEGYAFQIHSQDTRSIAQHLILIIQSYCDDDTRYTAALLLGQLIRQVQWYLDRARDFSLITKLGRKHKKCSVAIINHPQDAPVLTFDSTAWSYEHAAPRTCNITTPIVTTTLLTPDSSNTLSSTSTHSTHDAVDAEFQGYREHKSMPSSVSLIPSPGTLHMHLSNAWHHHMPALNRLNGHATASSHYKCSFASSLYRSVGITLSAVRFWSTNT